ncbi:glycoside hydrolase 15-related protein [Methanocaldococcus infernus ME]|uniref:Glycoside hydrolase 15-related protein n=1 Tax=Methanocaldococcus infernus (strain DSM 11812 / JCM 15783 / ME) TaxID=573063 RepID=D5VSM2_METIM|nr:glycoside hydrolase family 15 protein [Methanocaldococcus infernus]ADG13575.1 glycoside hydrolase 15-related protein [Methanocaldococcus infernus ME]
MILGNSGLLIKFGDYGEMEYLFYPNVGYEAHFFDGLFAVYDKNIKWCWDFKVSQVLEDFYLKSIYKGRDLEIVVKDYIPISHDVLIKDIFIKNFGEKRNLKFFFYENLRVGEPPKENVVKYIDGNIVKIANDYIFLISSSKKPSSYQCGHRYDKDSAYIDIENGILKENDESRGVLTDSALCWEFEIDRSYNFKIFILSQYKSNLDIALEQMKVIKHQISNIKNITMTYYSRVLENALKNIDKEYLSYRKIIEKALINLLFLSDRSGGIIASPSLHPDYRYVWGRDGSYIAIALLLYGIKFPAERFFKFMAKVQNPNGSWLQNYFVNGKPRLTGEQIDQAGSVIWALNVYNRLYGNKEFLERLWDMVEKAGNYLANSIFKPCFDLWEEKFAVFSYTTGAIYAGLKSAIEIGISLNKDIDESWYRSLERLKRDVNKLYSEEKGRFLKSINPIFEEIDTSILGLSYPFNLVKFEDERMIKTAEAIEKAFNYRVGGIGRYPEDCYFGGNPWIITTLWLSLYYKKLYEILNISKYKDKSNQLFKWCLKYSFEGLFPEQVHKDLGVPVSALPLGWSNAMFLIYTAKRRDIIIP